MQLDLDDDETLALLNLLVEVIEADRYPLSPRIRMLRQILAKFGLMSPAPPPARPPTPEERDPRPPASIAPAAVTVFPFHWEVQMPEFDRDRLRTVIGCLSFRYAKTMPHTRTNARFARPRTRRPMSRCFRPSRSMGCASVTFPPMVARGGIAISTRATAGSIGR
jgi:hypothetical protein